MSETDIERARRIREENSPHKIRRTWCNACGDGRDRLIVGVMPADADETALECPRCGARDSGTADPPEPGDPVDDATLHRATRSPADSLTAEEIASVTAELDRLEAEEMAAARRPTLTLVPMPDD